MVKSRAAAAETDSVTDGHRAAAPAAPSSTHHSTSTSTGSSRARRALVAGVLAVGALGAPVAASVTPAAAATTVTVHRDFGPDRYGTAAAASAATFAAGVPVVYVANGNAWADALPAAPLAGGKAPVLLVNGSTIPAATSAEVQRLAPGRIVLLGGTSVVPDSVGTALAKLSTSGSWSRTNGGDRYGTAAAISKAAFPNGAGVAYLASGTGYADGLTGAALAAHDGGPLLLTQPTSLPSVIATELARLHPSRIVILGGTGVVSAGVESALHSYAGTVTRAQGSDRYGTAIGALSSVASSATVVLVSGANFPDALTGGAIAAQSGAVVLPVPGYVASTEAAELAHLAPTRVVLLGGTSVLSSSVPSQVGTALGDTVSYSETVRPVTTTSSVDPATTYEQRILQLVNDQRTKAGLKPLVASSCASSFAISWAKHMASTGDFSHQSLSPILTTCHASTAGENIAYGNITADQMVTNWMNSAGHRANILNPAFTAVGTGAAVTSSGRWYGVQDFIG